MLHHREVHRLIVHHYLVRDPPLEVDRGVNRLFRRVNIRFRDPPLMIEAARVQVTCGLGVYHGVGL